MAPSDSQRSSRPLDGLDPREWAFCLSFSSTASCRLGPPLPVWTEGDSSSSQQRMERSRGGVRVERGEAHLVVIGRLTRHGKWKLGRTHTLSLAFALSATFGHTIPPLRPTQCPERRRCDANISTRISAQGVLGKSPMPTSPTPLPYRYPCQTGVRFPTLMLLRRLSWSSVPFAYPHKPSAFPWFLDPPEPAQRGLDWLCWGCATP